MGDHPPIASGSIEAREDRRPSSFRSFLASKLIARDQRLKKDLHISSDELRDWESGGLRPMARAAESCLKKLKVAIIGAGAAGLYAALILQDLGFQPPTIYEADPGRVGGRIYTHYFSKNGANLRPGDEGYYEYVDMGAMRIPILPTMERLLTYSDTEPDRQPSLQTNSEQLGEYGSLIRYLNDRLPADERLNIIKYYLSDASNNNLLLFNGKSPVKKGSHSANVDTGFALSQGGTVPDSYVSEGAQKWLDIVYDPMKHEIERDFETGFKELLKYDLFSTRFLMENFQMPDGARFPVVGSIVAGGADSSVESPKPVGVSGPYPRSVVDWLETVDSATGLYDFAFVESVMDSYDFGGDCGWHTVEGGMQRLPNAMLKILEKERSSTIPASKADAKKEGTSAVNFGSKVVEISPVGTPKGSAEGVELTVQTGENIDKETFDHVISTVTFGVLRTIATDACGLHPKKELAMRTLRYDNSVKVAITFKERFWENPSHKEDVILGGQSSTDRPSRTVVYPSYGLKSGGQGVLIASYTWAQDAARMGSLSHEERVKVCLADLRKLHGAETINTYYAGLEHTFSLDWYQAQNFCGAFALYGPGQFQDLYTSAIASEVDGRLHFAGECMSVHHAWIVGSLNSAYRTVFEILKHHKLEKQIKQLVQRWGMVDEVDLNPWISFDGQEV